MPIAERGGAGPSVVCVTGMHRSGTSLASRTLQLLGVSLGDDDGLLPPGPDNVAGYYENRAIKEFDDELLAHLGGSWDQPPVLEPGWEAAGSLDPFRAAAASILGQTFRDEAPHGLIGFKDPRVSLLLPFWRTVVPVRTTIVMVRDPREVASSLQARKAKVDPVQAYVLWLRYLFAATANDPGHLLVRNGDFFDDLPRTLGRITRHVGLPEAGPDAVDAVRAHLDPTLNHHRANDLPGDLPGDPPGDHPLARLADEVWNGGAPDLDALSPAFVDAVGRGWLRPPADSEALARARAEAVSFKEQLKRRNQEVRALKEASG